MDSSQQKLIIEYLLSSADLFATCHSIIKPEYFDPDLRNSVRFIKEYYDAYNALPDLKQVKANTGASFEIEDISRDKFNFCQDAVEHFCRRRALERAIYDAPKFLQDGDYNQVEKSIKDAIMISLHKNLGLDYFEDPLARLEAMAKADSLTSTGWPDVDDVLGGGLQRKEMILYSANSGGGKSITMANHALNLMKQGYSGIYASLELSEDLIAKRYDCMISNTKSVSVLNNKEQVARVIINCKDSMGSLHIKRFPVGSCANDMRAYLKEYELRTGKVPDFIVLDYLDLAAPNTKNFNGSDVFQKDKQTTEEFRELGEDYNLFLITASQQNRQAINAPELNHSHIAGGISKVNTTDVYVSIVMTPQMKAQGIMIFEFLKTRSSDGVGKRVQLKWVNDYLRVEHDPENGADAATQFCLPNQTKARPGVVPDTFSKTEGGMNILDAFNNDD